MSRVTRAERYAQIASLRKQGLVFREIAERLGIATSTARTIYTDPDGRKDRARKDRNVGECIDCGGATHNGGAVAVPERCAKCRRHYEQTDMDYRRRHRAAVAASISPRYTDEDIYQALRSAARDGVLSSNQYLAAYAVRTVEMPSLAWIVRRMGSWATAVEAAGLQTAGSVRGPYRNSFTRESAILAIQDCADDLGHWPSRNEYEAWGKSPSVSLIRGLFGGSWIAAIDAALAHEMRVVVHPQGVTPKL